MACSIFFGPRVCSIMFNKWSKRIVSNFPNLSICASSFELSCCSTVDLGFFKRPCILTLLVPLLNRDIPNFLSFACKCCREPFHAGRLYCQHSSSDRWVVVQGFLPLRPIHPARKSWKKKLYQSQFIFKHNHISFKWNKLLHDHSKYCMPRKHLRKIMNTMDWKACTVIAKIYHKSFFFLPCILFKFFPACFIGSPPLSLHLQVMYWWPSHCNLFLPSPSSSSSLLCALAEWSHDVNANSRFMIFTSFFSISKASLVATPSLGGIWSSQSYCFPHART